MKIFCVKTYKKNTVLFIALIAYMFSAQVQATACKVDYFELQEVEVRKPAKGLDDAGTDVLSEVITSLVTFGAGKIASVGLKSTAAGVKAANSKAFVVSKKLLSNDVVNIALGQAVQAAAEDTALEDWTDPVGYLIGELDDIIRTPDDLIVRIGGKRVVSGGESVFEMPALVGPVGIIDTRSFTQQPGVGSFVGSFDLQLIEYDSASANDDLGTLYGRDQNLLTDQLPPLNEEDVEVLRSSAEDDSHYRVKFKIIPGAGTLDDVPGRLFCNTDECQDAREGYPSDVYLGGYPSGSELKACPDSYTDAGYTYTGGASYTGTGPWYRVCELHTPNCGRPFTRLKDLGGVDALNDGDVIVLRVRTSHQVSETINPDFCDNLTDTCEPRRFSKYLSNSKNNGQYLGVCNDCYPSILNLQNAGAYFIERDRVDVQWTVKKIGSKYALQGSNGKYLARCLNCTDNGLYDAFVHVVDPNTPLAQFTIEESPTPEGDFIYTLRNDLGLYLDVCLGCRDDYKLGYGYSGSFNGTNANNYFAKWSIGVKQKDWDTDGDLVVDVDDACPNDPLGTIDSDGDGICNYADAFPFDPGENADSDGDGVANNADACPNDPLDTIDSDGDSVCDNADVFPDDFRENADADGDGVGDNRDRFPLNPSETIDTDADGIGNNGDLFPYDSDNLRHIEVDGSNGWIVESAFFTNSSSSPTPDGVVLLTQGSGFKLTDGIAGSTAKVTFTYPDIIDTSLEWLFIYCSILRCEDELPFPNNYYINNESLSFDGNKVTVVFQDGGIGDDEADYDGNAGADGVINSGISRSGLGSVEAGLAMASFNIAHVDLNPVIDDETTSTEDDIVVTEEETASTEDNIAVNEEETNSGGKETKSNILSIDFWLMLFLILALNVMRTPRHKY